MWFMPSYKRAYKLEELLKAPGGWPERVEVLVNEDQVAVYQDVLEGLGPCPWKIHSIPKDSFCADAHRIISERWPNEPFYGLLMDDLWPVTPTWFKQLEEVAGRMHIAWSHPLDMRAALCLGGDLVRAMGSLVPFPVKHWYEDDAWLLIGRTHNLTRVVHVNVEHYHHIRGTAKKDETYERSQVNADSDAEIFREWKYSKGFEEICAKVKKLVEDSEETVHAPKGRVCVLCVLKSEMDYRTHVSLRETMGFLNRAGYEYAEGFLSGISHIGSGRESLLWDAWYQLDVRPDYFLWIDSDMEWNPVDVLRLLSYDYEFVGAAALKKQDLIEFSFKSAKEVIVDKVTGCVQIEGIGMAFTLIKTSVIERMIKEHPEMEWRNPVRKRKEWALFMDMFSRDGKKTRLSEDLSFCERWRAIGGKIWIDPGIALGHIGAKNWVGRLKDYVEIKENEDATDQERVAESRKPEHRDGDGRWKAPEASSSHSAVGGPP